MKVAKFILILIAVLGAFVTGAFAAPRPNIILLMADDMGWGDPSYYSSTVTYADGSPHPDQGWISTPTMDTMASNGLRFDRFYSASSVCSPTRASCLTGRNPVRVGIGNANSGRLGFDETPLSVVLSNAGYVCGHFGKWHMGTMTTLRRDGNRGDVGNAGEYSAPWHHQYDTCFATESKVPTYHPYSGGLPLATSFEDSNFYGTRFWRIPATWNQTSGEGDIVPIEEVNNLIDGDGSKLLVDQAIPFMQDAVANNTPFFLVLWFHTPHKPVVDPDGVTSVNSPDAAKDAIEDLDDAIARVRNELTSLGVRGNTMFWVTSDNGPENGVDSFNENEVGRPIRSGRYRDRKGKFYEGGIIVPGILEWPDVITTPASTAIPAVTSDYYPTILDYLELSVPNQKPLDGISLRPIIEGTATTRVKPIGFKKGSKSAWMDNQYKLVKESAGWELFDLVNVAPGEEPEQTALADETNVTTKSQAIQDIYNSMLAEYNAWETTVNQDTPNIHVSQPTVVLNADAEVYDPFTVTATFSEDVFQLHAGEFVVTNGVASNLSGSGTSWTVTITPSVYGQVIISLPEGCIIDVDGNINADSGVLSVTYLDASGNLPPTFNSDPVVEINATESQAYSSTLADDASDVESDPMTFSKTSGPAWLTVAADGALSGTPDPADLGLNSWTVQVSDATGSDTTTLEITVDASSGNWTQIIYDDFEAGWGNYTPGSINDVKLYTSGLYAHQGNNAADIEDNNGDGSAFWLTSGVDVDSPAYTDIMVEFWYMGVNMESGEDFFLEYWDGSQWHLIKAWVSGVDFVNDQFYFESVIIPEANYTFPIDMKIKFRCDATGGGDDVYIDEIRISVSDGTPANNAPTFTVDPINEIDATEDAAYSSSIADDAFDPESDPMTFSKTGGPGWLSVAGNGGLSGTPANADVGNNVFTIQVDATGGSDTATLNITVYGSADINGDGVFNLEDFGLIARNWQNACSGPTWCDGADLDISGTVEIADLQAFAASWLD